MMIPVNRQNTKQLDFRFYFRLLINAFIDHYRLLFLRVCVCEFI